MPGDRGEDQPREERVGKRLGRVGEAVEDDPAAQRATGHADKNDLGESALHERFLQGLEHCSVVVMVRWQDRPALRPGDLDDGAAVGRLQHGQVGEHALGLPAGDLALVDAENEVATPRLLEIVGGDRRSPAPLPPARRSALPVLRRSAGRGRRRARRAAARRRPEPAPRAINTRWRWPPESRPKVRSASAPQADPVERARAAASRSRAAGAPPPGQARGASPSSPRRAPRRGSRGASARSGARCRRSPPTRSVPASGAQLAEQHPQQRRLAAAVGPEQGQRLPRRQRELDAGDRRRAVVAGAETGRPRSGRRLHPRLPPVNPRTIESALAASIRR